jgi:hypothetical protein
VGTLAQLQALGTVEALQAVGDAILARTVRDRPKTRKRDRPKCGAATRAGGTCQAPAVWDRALDAPRNGRCRMHGGLTPRPVARPPDPLAILDALLPGEVLRTWHGNIEGAGRLIDVSIRAENLACAEIDRLRAGGRFRRAG